MSEEKKLNATEQSRRNYLKETKPYVYAKVQRFSEKIQRGESIAVIQMQYNYACNFSCVHCAIKPLQNPVARSMTPDDVAELARQADEIGLARFVITGGEPLVFKDLDEVVKAIGPERFYINMDTNGWHLDHAKARHLKSIGVDRIQLSLDSLDAEEHDAFRRAKGSHERAMRAVDAALDADLQIFVQTVVTRQRLYSEEFIQFIEHFNARGIGVFVTYAKPVGAWAGSGDDMLVTREDMRYFENILEKKYKVFTHLTPAYGLHMGCIAVKGMFSVTQTGDVLPCPYVQISLGNIFKEPLKDIVERGLQIKHFGEYRDTCLIAEDRDFIFKVDRHTAQGELPVPCSRVYDASDRTVVPFHLTMPQE
ncbi:radical SAM protein [Desulfovibrio sp. OttesenSCG-928-C14]|nr:radical SAM protein [Desulfovibrio sp. OttesenSCG-928-C14]